MRSSAPRNPAAARAQAHKLIDPKALMRIKGLEMRAKVVVQGFYSGLHKSPFHGFSVEFSEYREYSPGDDPRYLDWKLYARSDRYYLKRFEDETNLRCYLLVDTSTSMGYGSGDYTKADYAKTLAATLGYFLSTQRDAVGLVTFADKVGEYLPARYRPGHLRGLMLALEKPLEGQATDLVAPLKRVAELVTRRGLIVLITDLLAPIEELEINLAAVKSRGHDVLLFQILDPAEVAFEFDQPALFEDIESGRDLYVDPVSARKQYLESFAEHTAACRRSCDKLGIEFHRLTTDQPMELTLFDFLRARMHRGRRIRRSSAASGRRTA